MLEVVSRYGWLGSFILFKNVILTKLWYRSARLIRFPFRVRGRRFIAIGKGLTTGVNCRLDAFPLEPKVCMQFGDDVQINDLVHIAAIDSIIIGDNVLIASHVFLTDHNHGSYGVNGVHTAPIIPPVERELSYAPVQIGSNVWIGEFVSVLPGVTIGEGAVIGTMSVVNRDIPAYSIAVGSPARVIKRYDFDKKEWVRA